MTVTTSDAQLVERYGDAWNSHDLDAILSLHTDDTEFRLHLLGAPAVSGRDAVRDAFAGLLMMWPDMYFDTTQLSFGDGFFVNQYVFSGTLAMPMPFGDLLAKPTGVPISFTGVDVITLTRGLVHRKETFLDIADAQRQLGLFGSDEPTTA